MSPIRSHQCFLASVNVDPPRIKNICTVYQCCAVSQKHLWTESAGKLKKLIQLTDLFNRHTCHKQQLQRCPLPGLCCTSDVTCCFGNKILAGARIGQYAKHTRLPQAQAMWTAPRLCQAMFHLRFVIVLDVFLLIIKTHLYRYIAVQTAYWLCQTVRAAYRLCSSHFI